MPPLVSTRLPSVSAVSLTAQGEHETLPLAARSHVGYLRAAQAPLQTGTPNWLQDWRGSHSTQKAPEAVQPEGQGLHDPVVFVVKHIN